MNSNITKKLAKAAGAAALFAVVLGTAGAGAQGTTGSVPPPGSAPIANVPPAAERTPEQRPPVNAAPLQQGANSFTAGQARTRLEQAGFAAIEDLKKDESGIWRGRATQDGRQVSVGLDFRGNIAAQ